MKERPILFSGPMVRAILEGRKAMTRRVVKPQPTLHNDGSYFFFCSLDAERHQQAIAEHCPYGVPGDRLWVRETWTIECGMLQNALDGKSIHYCSDCKGDTTGLFAPCKWKKRPSIFMPRVASRLTLDVTVVRVERLQTINHEDCVAEGAVRKPHFMIYGGEKCLCSHSRYRKEFSELWDSINGKRPGCSWEDNPWVWVVEFKKVQ